ncbi:MAG: methyl-accepting chemotaxis protein [Firmicutes bacterium]|nr:methyl-accepting chemotaxis protein [Bacillota bacterium]
MKLKSPGGFRRKPGFSVTTKIAVALSLLILFLMSAVGTSLFLRDQALFQKDLREKGWNIAHTALPFISSHLQTGNIDTLNRMMMEIAAYQNISYAMVLDSGGKVLAHSDERQAGGKTDGEQIKNALAAKADVSQIYYNERGKPALMDFISPVTTAGGGTIGYFRLGIDLSGLNRHARETIANIIVICLAAILAGIFLASVISKRILQKPLQDLTAATEKLATGDFSYKVPVRKQDELGELAASFNTMTVHLANLIQSVKTSAQDINKSAGQILGRLQTSDRTNSKLSRTFDLLQQGTAEQVAILKKSASLAEQLAGQSKQVMDFILQVLSEVNKAVQTGESGVSAVSKIAASLVESGQSLEITKDSLKQLENKGRQLLQTIASFSDLLDKTTACTVRAALEAARSGNKELTRAAEDLQRLTEESNLRIKQMAGELAAIENTRQYAESVLEGNAKMLAGGQEAVLEARASLEQVLHSLTQGKGMIEEIASAAHRQAASLEEIRQSQNETITELLKSINKSSTAGSDTKLQMESLQDIDSLAKKLMRMVDRLNVLSLQFKV